MSKSSQSSDSSSDSQYPGFQEKLSDWEIYRTQELYEIFQREEYKKYAIVHEKFDATKEFDERAFDRASRLVAYDEEAYDEIEEIIWQKIDQIIGMEKFTEEDLQKINELEQQQYLGSGDGNSSSSSSSSSQEGNLPDALLTDANLEPLRIISGREHYYDAEQKFFREITQSVIVANQSDVGALPKIFARFLNEFNDDLNGDDLDVEDLKLYKDLMNRQRSFISEAMTLLDPSIRQQVVIDALKQSESDLHLQENFVRLISKPLIKLGCNEVMAFLADSNQHDLAQDSSRLNAAGSSGKTTGNSKSTTATTLQAKGTEREV